jgi:hypothetical protein
MKQRIYLCGAIDNNKNYKEDFEKAETIVSETFRSYEVVNPSNLQRIEDRKKELSSCHYLVILDDYAGDWKRNVQIQEELSICGKNQIKVLHLSLLSGI